MFFMKYNKERVPPEFHRRCNTLFFFYCFCSAWYVRSLTTSPDRVVTWEHYYTKGQGQRTSQSIKLIPDDTFQEVKGYGGSLTNSAAYVIWTSDQRNEILDELFSTSGLELSYLRLTMGGSDFQAVEPYTYDDQTFPDKDFNMTDFRISKDRLFMIPVLKEALKRNRKLRIMATPWSAPAWMKTTLNLHRGSLIDTPEYMSAYAKYFVEFVKEYEKEGIHIDAMTIQNEPRHVANYPTMYMSAEQQKKFVKLYLGPMFEIHGLTTVILIHDHNWGDFAYPLEVLADRDVRGHVGGVAWHCYTGEADQPREVHDKYNIDMYFTECTGGLWDTDFGRSMDYQLGKLFIGQSNIGARIVLMWNIALNEKHGPKAGVVGGCTDCRGVIRVNPDGSYDLELEYFIINHMTKFVKPGAFRIRSSFSPPPLDGAWMSVVAFKNTDGSVAVVLHNKNETEALDFHVELGESVFNFDPIPPFSAKSILLETELYKSRGDCLQTGFLEARVVLTALCLLCLSGFC